MEVEWINTQMIFDWNQFQADKAFNMEFCATALYCNDEKNANMAMEVILDNCTTNLETSALDTVMKFQLSIEIQRTICDHQEVRNTQVFTKFYAESAVQTSERSTRL